MTPVEERIDHPRERLTAWLNDVQLSNRLGSPVYANPSELKADLCALLTEHSAREEALMRRCLEAEKFDAQFENSRLPGDSALSALFLSFEEVLALPATEPAQPGDENVS